MIPSVMLILSGLTVAAVVALWLFGERWRLLSPSTRRLLREGGLRRFLKGDFFHAYAYARWSNQYIGWAINRLFPRLKPTGDGRRWADAYHGKVLTHDQARAIIAINQSIPLQDLEQVIPYATARDIVLEAPPDMAVYECPCRHARPRPCQPTQVCMIVGRPFVDFILEHHPHTCRRIERTEALELLRAEQGRGHIHAAYFKDVMLGRFFAICNCCACCCGGIEAIVRHGVPMLTSSGYVARVNEARCSGCGSCAGACPFGAIQGDGRPRVEWERCMGCGVCVGLCPDQALSLVRDERKGMPLDVRLMSAR